MSLLRPILIKQMDYKDAYCHLSNGKTTYVALLGRQTRKKDIGGHHRNA